MKVFSHFCTDGVRVLLLGPLLPRRSGPFLVYGYMAVLVDALSMKLLFLPHTALSPRTGKELLLI